jgi:hypothetical protein
VYKNGIPFYINREGKKAFECNYTFLNSFSNNRAKISNTNNQQGIIDRTGKLILDTFFTNIHPFVEGLAVVYRANDSITNKSDNKTNEASVIDTNGKYIIPFGKYEYISDLTEGYFVARKLEKQKRGMMSRTMPSVLLDRDGNVISPKTDSNRFSIVGDMHCGRTRIKLNNRQIPDKISSAKFCEADYYGFINALGTIVIADTSYRTATDFSCNRAFVKNSKMQYFMIDRNGKIVGDKTYQHIGPRFSKGTTAVSVDNKWGLIDTNAVFIAKPEYEEIGTINSSKNLFFYAIKNLAGQRLLGILSASGRKVTAPTLEQIDFLGFYNGLLKCVVGNKDRYINEDGQFVWQESNIQVPEISDLDIDYMRPEYYKVPSKSNKVENGEDFSSTRFVELISKSGNFQKGKLNLLVIPELEDTFELYDGSRRHKGITVIVANATDEDVFFHVDDLRLNMKVQALDASKQWKDIEYMRQGFYDNSWSTATLGHQHYWRFITPVYGGSFKTKLRMKLIYLGRNIEDGEGREGEVKVIYSNTYEGNVNPAQFWRNPDNQPNGTMNDNHN